MASTGPKPALPGLFNGKLQDVPGDHNRASVRGWRAYGPATPEH